MKKTLIFFLTAALAFSLFAACSRDGSMGMNGKNDTGDKSPADKVADGVSDAAKGMANAADDIWDGLTDILDGPDGPKTARGSDAAFARDYGMDEGWLDSYTLMTAKADNDPSEFFIAKVKSGNMAKVEQALEKRRTAISSKWKDASGSAAYASKPVIFKNGDYVMLAVHSDTDKLKSEFERLTKNS